MGQNKLYFIVYIVLCLVVTIMAFPLVLVGLLRIFPEESVDFIYAVITIVIWCIILFIGRKVFK